MGGFLVTGACFLAACFLTGFFLTTCVGQRGTEGGRERVRQFDATRISDHAPWRASSWLWQASWQVSWQASWRASWPWRAAYARAWPAPSQCSCKASRRSSPCPARAPACLPRPAPVWRARLARAHRDEGHCVHSPERSRRHRQTKPCRWAHPPAPRAPARGWSPGCPGAEEALSSAAVGSKRKRTQDPWAGSAHRSVLEEGADVQAVGRLRHLLGGDGRSGTERVRLGVDAIPAQLRTGLSRSSARPASRPRPTAAQCGHRRLMPGGPPGSVTMPQR